MFKIALLTYPMVIPYFEETIAPLRDQCQIDIIPFERQHNLLTLIPTLADQYDGFCVFSALAGKFIMQTNPGMKKPIVFLDKHCVDYFKTFFIMLNEDRDINFSRVLIDTSMTHQNGARTLDDLARDIAFFEDNLLTYTTELSLEDFINMEAQIEKNALDSWRQGEFDILVCRFASIAEVMEREGVPHVFVYPDKYWIKTSIKNLLNQIHMEKQSEGLPASIMIFTDSENRRDFQEVSQDSIRMQKALLEFSKNCATSFTIQFIAKGFEILTSNLTVQKITEDFTCCQLGYFLFSTLGTNVRVAYGVGNDIGSARLNALQAAKACANADTSCVVTEEGRVIPLHMKLSGMDSAEQKDSASLLAIKTGLSTITIQRIRSALQYLGTTDITNQGLAEALQVTVANANRILNALIDGGQAEVVDMKKSMSKGRPSRIYRIAL
ncbi:MAG: hypothetical protein FWH28_05140 [Clostridiales bacterium]|nr:hypothetical protein [Clostridiales bacterium]